MVKNGKWLLVLLLLSCHFPVLSQDSLTSKLSLKQFKKVQYKSLPSGLNYAYLSKSKTGMVAGTGGYLKFHVAIISQSDSLLDNTFGSNRPAEVLIPAPTHKGCIYEGFAMLRAGDSVLFRVVGDSLYQKTFKLQTPPTIKSGEHITLLFKVLESMNNDSFKKVQEAKQLAMMKAAEAQMDTDVRKLSEAADKMGYGDEIDLMPSGVGFVKLKETDSAMATEGDEASFYYKGTFINGEVFDSNIGGQPLTRIIGEGGLIEGWLQVMEQMRLGEKWLVFIPSALAYGTEGRGVIKPNTPLIFEIELVKLKPAMQVAIENEEEVTKMRLEEGIKLEFYILEEKNKHLQKQSLTGINFYYAIEQEGTGAIVQPGDSVLILIQVSDLEGNVVDALTRMDSPAGLTVAENLWPIFRESLLKLNTGAKIRVVTPSSLFQGEQGAPGLEPFTPVEFTMELIEIVKPAGGK